MALSVAKHVYKQLSGNASLTDIVGERIYPGNVDGTPAFPFVVFDVETGEPDYTKDGDVTDHHTVTVYVLARHYMNELLPAAEAVRQALELQLASYPDYEVTEATLGSAVNGWDETLQSQTYTLTFSLTTETPVPVSCADGNEDNPEIV